MSSTLFPDHCFKLWEASNKCSYLLTPTATEKQQLLHSLTFTLVTFSCQVFRKDSHINFGPLAWSANHQVLIMVFLIISTVVDSALSKQQPARLHILQPTRLHILQPSRLHILQPARLHILQPAILQSARLHITLILSKSQLTYTHSQNVSGHEPHKLQSTKCVHSNYWLIFTLTVLLYWAGDI